jgi:hypothetical protein
MGVAGGVFGLRADESGLGALGPADRGGVDGGAKAKAGGGGWQGRGAMESQA